MTELYIEDNLMELGGTKITQVFQINDIGEPRDRQLNFSYTFKIPATSKNVKVLEMLGVVGNTSSSPYRKLKAKIIENGAYIVPNGILEITSKSKGDFQANLVGGNAYLFEAIGAKKLKDLYFYPLNHDITFENIINSFNNEEGYIYALSNFGKLDKKNIDITYQVPSLFVHTVLKMIFDEAGVKYYGDVFETEEFKNKIITMAEGYTKENSKQLSVPVEIKYNLDVFKFNPVELAYDKYRSLGAGYNYELEYWEKGSYVVKSKIISNLPNDNPDGDSFFVSFKIDYTARSFNAWHEVGKEVSLVIFEDDNPDGRFTTIHKKVQIIYPDDDFTSEKNINVGAGWLKSDKYYKFVLFTKKRSSYVSNISFQIKDLKLNNIASIRGPGNKPTYGIFDFQNYIGDMKQIDFVKDIMQEYGLISQKRAGEELAYDFVQMKKILSDRSNLIDWSKKYAGEVSEKYKPTGYAQKNIFSYNYPDKDHTDVDGTLTINNENLPPERNVLKRPYNAPEKNGYSLTYYFDMYKTLLWKEDRDDEGKLKGYKPFKSKNYIGKVGGSDPPRGTLQFSFGKGRKQAYGNWFTVFTFPKEMHYNEILKRHYQEINTLLDFSCIKTVHLLLNELDIKNLDLFKIVYLEQYQSDFYINKIRYTDSKTVSRVELVRIRRNN